MAYMPWNINARVITVWVIVPFFNFQLLKMFQLSAYALHCAWVNDTITEIIEIIGQIVMKLYTGEDISGTEMYSVIIHLIQGAILYKRSANERRRYIVTSSLTGWSHAQNDPCWYISATIMGLIAIELAWFNNPHEATRKQIDHRHRNTPWYRFLLSGWCDSMTFVKVSL